MKLKNIIYSISALLVIISSCASPGMPTGGPKDKEPPKIKKSTPKLNALGYKKKTVTIDFNEIIKLNDVYSKFIASPPLKKRPKINAYGSKLVINFQEELQDNTTYTLDFGDAIADNNENNPIPSFVFSFSTGTEIDSMAVFGNVWDADDLSPAEGTLVLAYKNLSDTAFTHDVPLRLGLTDEKGHFSIHNLSPGKYHIFALEDANRNYKFDQPGEYIAWYDSIVIPGTAMASLPDTLENDSVVFRNQMVYTPNDLKLFLFKQDEPIQYLLSEKRRDSIRMNFLFNAPVENFAMHPVGEYNKDWAVFEFSQKKDTVNVWITDSAVYNNDTLEVVLNYQGLDTLKNSVLITDTISMFYFRKPPPKKKRRRRNNKDKEKPKIKTLKLEDVSRTVDLKGSFNFTMPTPIEHIDFNKFRLYELEDTVYKKCDYKLIKDSILNRRYKIKKQWTQGAEYLFIIDSASIFDKYGMFNDSIGYKFNVKKIEDYGTILIDISNSDEDCLIQLLHSGENIVQEKYVPKTGKLAFQYVNPGDYFLKIVVDENHNKKWDIGNYKKKIQPEKIYYYPDTVSVRPNWDITVKWDPAKFDIYKYTEKNRKPKRKKNTN